jgi:type IV secretion system VirB5/TraC/TraE/TrbJ family protein
MRNLLLPLVRFLSFSTLFLTLPAHAQWAVVDVFAQVQWPTQIRTMVEQYNILKAQYEKLRQQVVEAERTNQYITGATGKAWLINGVAEQTERRWLPSSWQDVIAMQKAGLNAGRYSDRLKWYEDRLKTIDSKIIVPGVPGHRANWNYQLSSDHTRAAFSAAEALFDNLDKRLRNVEALNAQIERADSLKQAIDLNSRMLAEQSFISIELARLQSMQLMLLATAQNGNNSGMATRAEFLKTN